MNNLEFYLSAHKAIPSGASFSDGIMLGEWRVTAFLGKGGSGEVYQVAHIRTGVTAAVKILMRDDALARERFRREVEILERNDCPSFPQYFADGEIDGRPYLIVELLDQCPLPSADKDVERYVLAICQAVGYLHKRGLVHRDIKPSNVLRRANGEPVLIDFGLVKPISKEILRHKEDLSIVDGKVVGVGTPRYAAPEQFNGDEITPVSDVHALGMLLNECFGGEPPRVWRKIIAKATSSIPSNRYAAIDLFVAAIRNRNRRKDLAIYSVAFAFLVCAVTVIEHLDGGSPDQIAWERLCGRTVSTNVVQKVLVDVKWMDLNGMKIPAERRFKLVSNRVDVAFLTLGGLTNIFADAVRLAGGREYWVTGPGLLEGTFFADGSNVTIRLKNCIMRNHAAEPLGKVGICYDLQDGAGLDLPELDEPDDHGRHYIERSGSPTRLNFKKIDWGEPVIMRDEQGAGL